jgi:hypothetical protein
MCTNNKQSEGGGGWGGDLGELKKAYRVGGQVMSGIIMGNGGGGWLNGTKGDRCGF